jgi:hypothetical protein
MDAISAQFKGASVLELREIIDAVAAICPEGRERASTLYRVLPPESKKSNASLETIIFSLAQKCEKCKGVIDMWKAYDDTWKSVVDVQAVAGWRSIFTGRKPPGYLGLPGSNIQSTSAVRLGEAVTPAKIRPVSKKLPVLPFLASENQFFKLPPLERDTSGSDTPSWKPANAPNGQPPQYLAPMIYPPASTSTSPPGMVENGPPPVRRENGHYDAVKNAVVPTQMPQSNLPTPNGGLESWRQEVKEEKTRAIATNNAAPQYAPRLARATVGESLQCHMCTSPFIVEDHSYNLEMVGDEPAPPLCNRCLDGFRLRCETCCKTYFGKSDGSEIKCRECQDFEKGRTICEMCYEWTPDAKCHYKTGIEGHQDDPICDDCLKQARMKHRERKELKKRERQKRRMLRKQEAGAAENANGPSLPS